MNFPFITGDAQKPPPQPLDVPLPDREGQVTPEGYLADQALMDAVNVALLLGQPLLLTGEPGTGKTQLAYRVSWELGYGKPLRFDTKSTSTARDLFYQFDTLRRFHAAQTGGTSSQNNMDYITYTALGQAILLSKPVGAVQHLLPRSFQHPGTKRSVVLIDEVDKAPRDFPNDLLNEVEQMSFRIPELGNEEIVADQRHRPVLILTSNSEKNLPDAFLRRCIFYHIPFPDKARLAKIILSRGRSSGQNVSLTPFQASTLDFFLSVRTIGLQKPPSTAELINWLHTMEYWEIRPEQKVSEIPAILKRSLSTLAKNAVDIEALEKYVEKVTKAV